MWRQLIKKIKNNQGFTLAEILISIIVALLILTIITSIFALDQRVYRKSLAKSELIQNARIILETINKEVRQAREIVTVLPPDNSNPALVAHELQFEDGNNDSQIQYIKYYLDEDKLKRKIIVYYFDYAPTTYVYWDDTDPFGSPVEGTLEDKTIGELFTGIDFYGLDEITVDCALEKNEEIIEMQTKISPRNTE